jgi:hypothetical protein
MEKLTWEVRKVNLSDLNPLENNPFGKVTEEKRKRLRESLLRLGDFQIATVDTDMVLLTANKRFFALKELGETETQVKFPSRKLTDEERKEIIVSSNLHEGDWIAEILERDYQDIDLKAMGLEMDDMVESVINTQIETEIEKVEIKPYNKTHVLLSMAPNVFLKASKYLEQLKQIEGIEYEQSSN